jgi:Rho-binding antiterminator
MKDRYIPVSCDFHDEMIALATRKEPVKIFVFNEEGTLDGLSGIIEDVYTHNGEEFILIENNKPVRLDKIITWNGKPGPDYDRLEKMDHDCHECK